MLGNNDIRNTMQQQQTAIDQEKAKNNPAPKVSIAHIFKYIMLLAIVAAWWNGEWFTMIGAGFIYVGECIAVLKKE